MNQHDKKTNDGNSTFAIGGVSCSADTFVVIESLVLRINICLKSPPTQSPQLLTTVKNTLIELR